MHEPSLTRHLRVLAFDVPLFMTTQAHQQLLVGTGAYARRATVAAWRWSSRMVLVLVLVGGAGLSIDGALAAIVGASVLELIVARRSVHPKLRGGSPQQSKTMRVCLPLFAGAISLRLFDKLDLPVLGVGGSATLAGLAGAAQNLTIIPTRRAIGDHAAAFDAQPVAAWR
jgi:hypothetical protein